MKKTLLLSIILILGVNAAESNKQCTEAYDQATKILDKEITYEKILPLFVNPRMKQSEREKLLKGMTENDETLNIREKLKACNDDGATQKQLEAYGMKKIGQIAIQALPLVMTNALVRAPETIEQDKNATIPVKEKIFTPVKGVKGFVDLSYENNQYGHLRMVKLHAGYKNNTKKTIYGVISQIKVTNVFGDVILDNELKDEVKIRPGKRYKPNHYRSWNSHTDIYKKLWRAVDSKTYKAEITIKKVIFKDGTTLGE